MKIGLYPGSFDPITNGHLGVIDKGSKLFDKLYVCILKNSQKNALFKENERLEMAKEALKDYKNVEVVIEETLTIEACHKYNAEFILRGLRTTADFEFEFRSNNINEMLDPNIKTVLVMTNISESHISSTIVRELLSYNSEDYKNLVPKAVSKYINKKIKI